MNLLFSFSQRLFFIFLLNFTLIIPCVCVDKIEGGGLDDLKEYFKKNKVSLKQRIMNAQEWEKLKENSKLPQGNYLDVTTENFSKVMGHIGLYRIKSVSSPIKKEEDEYYITKEIYVGMTIDDFRTRLRQHKEAKKISKNAIIYLYDLSETHGNSNLYKACTNGSRNEKIGALIPYETALIKKYCPYKNIHNQCQ